MHHTNFSFKAPVDMPIIIKDYEWTESETRIDLTLPQKGIKGNNIDVMVTNFYIKVQTERVILTKKFHGSCENSFLR